MANDLPFTFSIPSDDSTIISKKYWNKIKVGKIANEKGRNPVSMLRFDKKYHLLIYRIDLTQNLELPDVLNNVNECVDRTTGIVYTVINLNDFCRFEYHASAATPASKIFLTLAGDSLQEVKNDSAVSYHLICKNLSVRYSEEQPVDIYMVGTELLFGNTTRIPMDLLLLKRNAAVYLLIMMPDNPKATIAADILYNMVLDK